MDTPSAIKSRKIAATLKDFLVRAAYGVSCLDRGDAVVPFVRQNPPCLILLDIMIPGEDGMEVCREGKTLTRIKCHSRADYRLRQICLPTH